MIIHNKFVLFLKCIPGISDSAIRKLINLNMLNDINFDSQQSLLTWLNSNQVIMSKKFDPSVLTLDDIMKAKMKRELIETNLEKISAKYITYFDVNYPNSLKKIKDYPIILFYKGDISLLNSKKLCTIIGTRNPSQETIIFGEAITKRMVEKNYVIISGLALGCDTIAHRTCLKFNGKTISILATGIDKVYPKENTKLVNDIILNKGLVMTEQLIGFSGATYSFANRDRLQAALSDITIALETGIDGGTMHAAKSSTSKYNKKLITIDPKVLPRGNTSGNIELYEKYKAIYIKSIEDLNEKIIF